MISTLARPDKVCGVTFSQHMSHVPMFVVSKPVKSNARVDILGLGGVGGVI